ncbi:hypothetical protein K435DRAFT_930610 [Dendrothele bispora CBS 962.96]|uniref:Uncharacterized protein n=1 Tax=Dendrothele bispora (strain CBS 962.96) TaxID=1314807 RepID=A0A4S8L4H4_DENBC|nr:hypothetical protein K435DRAFT_930610 [Dendrothele bispora CBS 962.96]
MTWGSVTLFCFFWFFSLHFQDVVCSDGLKIFTMLKFDGSTQPACIGQTFVITWEGAIQLRLVACSSSSNSQPIFVLRTSVDRLHGSNGKNHTSNVNVGNSTSFSTFVPEDATPGSGHFRASLLDGANALGHTPTSTDNSSLTPLEPSPQSKTQTTNLGMSSNNIDGTQTPVGSAPRTSVSLQLTTRFSSRTPSGFTSMGHIPRSFEPSRTKVTNWGMPDNDRSHTFVNVLRSNPSDANCLSNAIDDRVVVPRTIIIPNSSSTLPVTTFFSLDPAPATIGFNPLSSITLPSNSIVLPTMTSIAPSMTSIAPPAITTIIIAPPAITTVSIAPPAITTTSIAPPSPAIASITPAAITSIAPPAITSIAPPAIAPPVITSTAPAIAPPAITSIALPTMSSITLPTTLPQTLSILLPQIISITLPQTLSIPLPSTIPMSLPSTLTIPIPLPSTLTIPIPLPSILPHSPPSILSHSIPLSESHLTDVASTSNAPPQPPTPPTRNPNSVVDVISPTSISTASPRPSEELQTDIQQSLNSDIAGKTNLRQVDTLTSDSQAQRTSSPMLVTVIGPDGRTSIITTLSESVTDPRRRTRERKRFDLFPVHNQDLEAEGSADDLTLGRHSESRFLRRTSLEALLTQSPTQMSGSLIRTPSERVIRDNVEQNEGGRDSTSIRAVLPSRTSQSQASDEVGKDDKEEEKVFMSRAERIPGETDLPPLPTIDHDPFSDSHTVMDTIYVPTPSFSPNYSAISSEMSGAPISRNQVPSTITSSRDRGVAEVDWRAEIEHLGTAAESVDLPPPAYTRLPPAYNRLE